MADINLNINAKNNASDTIKKIASDTKGLEGQFKKLGATIASVFAAREIFKFAKDSINATREFNSFARSIASTEMALGKFGSNASWKTVLNNVNGQVDGLKKMSNQYGVVINDVLSMRKELAEPFSFLDSNTINQLLPKLAAAGATMGISVGQMANEIDAVIDGRLKERSSVLVKSLGMDVSTANQMGGQKFIKELMLKLNSMENVFKEYSQSDEGKIAKFENSLNDFKITLGNTLLPSLTKLLESLKEPLEKFSKTVSSQPFQDFISKIGDAIGVAVEHPVATVAGIGAAKIGSDVIGNVVGVTASSLLVKQMPQLIGLMTRFGPIAVILAEILATVAAIKYLSENPSKSEATPRWSVDDGTWKAGNFWTTKEPDLNNYTFLMDTTKATGFELLSLQNTIKNANILFNLFGESTTRVISVLDYFGEKPDDGEVDPRTAYGSAYDEASAQAAEVYDRWMKRYEKAASQPIKVEISLKADMPYQASLSLTDSSGTQNKKIAPRVSDGRLSGRI